MAWGFGRYVERVARAGAAEHALPAYANAWLGPKPGAEQPGQYPSGGPVARMMDVWKAAAPSLVLLAPDIYIDDFTGVLKDYKRADNPIFIPEAKIDAGNLSPHRAQLSTPADADRHRVIPQAVHDAGGRIVLQLLHSGRYGFHERIVAPSAVKSPINPHAPREMSAGEIEETIADFVRAAALARSAGYDGVEIMGSEGYLITQFLAARTNHRKDDWGGPLANRMRFATEIVRRTRAAAGKDFIIVYRISALDLVEGGLAQGELLEVAKAIESEI